MPRERWFYAQANRRVGPVAKRELVEALLHLTDPRSSLVWRHGLHAWTPAAQVPEIDRLLAPFAPAEVRAPAPAPASAAAPAAPAQRERGSAAARSGRLKAGARPRSRAPLFAGAGVGLLVVGLLVWQLWPRQAAEVPPPDVSPPVSENASTAPTPASTPAVIATLAPRPTGAPAAGGGVDQEGDLPAAELRRLRGVAGWTGDKLTITLYNGSSWRVTEIYVLTSRIENDQFVDSPQPQRLLPAGGAPVDAAVGQLLKRVAPDRKRAGVNPADTGPFEGIVGPQPQGYRWKIVSARGYPPRPG